MKNITRALVFGGQVSLTLADTTDMVQEAIKLHSLHKTSALVLGKALSAMTFMSACLKQETGEISLSFQGDGAGGDIGVSGNRKLFLRGYIGNTGVGEETDERACLGENGALTIVRDDGYNRPFVGTCGLPDTGGVDEAFEEYFRISEQLPTRLKTVVEIDENGACAFAGVAAMQPLPFAGDDILEKVENASLTEYLQTVKAQGAQQALVALFKEDTSATESREARYRCNCSREYLARVLVTLGETEMRRIVKEDGAVRVHCHYCNTDYEFTDADADEIFKKA